MLRLDVYDTMTGIRLNHAGIPFSKCSWSQSWNTAGGMNVTIPLTRGTRDMDLDGLLVEQSTLLALWDGERIVHAGPILESPEWDAESQSLSVKCGDAWSLFDWRLVLDPLLRNRVFDGPVTVDEDDPTSEWVVGYAGSGGDIVKGLIGLTQQWGRLCVNVPVGYEPQHGGSPLSFTWAAWDYTTVSNALADVLAMEYGGQLRFDPGLQEDGRFYWQARWAQDGIVDHEWKWNADAPGQRIRFTGIGSGGNPIINQVWASGGNDNGQLLLTRADDTDMQADTILLQSGSSTSTDSLASLHATARGTLAASRRDRVWKLECAAGRHVQVGDHIDLRVNDPYLHDRDRNGNMTSTLIPLVVTDVAGEAGGEWVSLQARQRAASVDGIRPGDTDPLIWVRRRMDGLERMAMAASNPTALQAYGVIGKLRQLLGGK